MKFQKKVSLGNYLKKGTDFKDGDLLEVLNEGKEVSGEYGTQNVFMVKIGDKEGNVSFNQTSINGLIDAYGEDSIGWVGKKVKASKVKQNVAGKFIDVWYFSHPDAELTENGFLMPNKEKKSEKMINADEIPVVEDGDQIDIKDIPF